MSLDISFTVFVLFTVLGSVFGATCTNSTSCVATTHTTGVCDANTKVCACDSTSAPIRTGCGTKLSRPTLTQPAGYSTVVLEGKSATLTCTSPEGATVFEWTFKNNVINSAKASTYTIAAASASDVGAYKCKAKSSESAALDSDLSAELSIDVLLKNATTISILPTVSLSTTTIFAGKTVNISCVNIPIGYDTTKIAITNGATPPVPYTSSLTITDANKGAAVQCDLNDLTAHTSKIISTAITLPTLATEITVATISSTILSTDVYTKDAPITLKCVPTPDVPYVDLTTKPITWAWVRDSTDISGATSQTYDIPMADGTYTIKCRVSTPTSTAVISNSLTIVRNSNLVANPNITANPTIPVLGSRLTLTCGTLSNTNNYSWKKDNTDIARQFEQIIQLDNLTTSDNGDYICTASNSKVTQNSDAFTVKVGGGQEMVNVSMFVLGLAVLMSKVFA